MIPYPKAAPRKISNAGRKPGRTRILTDSPEKKEIEERLKKKVKLNLGQVTQCENKKNGKKQKDYAHVRKSGRKLKKKKKATSVMESSSESESFHSSGSSSLDFAELEDHDFDFDANKINVGDFLLVKFCTKTNVVHYVGRVEKELDDGYEINFLRKRGSGFIFPNVPDIATIQQQDVVLKLPSPFKSVASGRLFSVMYSDVDLSNFEKLR